MEARFQFRLPRQPGREWGGKTLCYAEDTHVMSLSSATHLTEEDSTRRVEYKSPCRHLIICSSLLESFNLRLRLGFCQMLKKINKKKEKCKSETCAPARTDLLYNTQLPQRWHPPWLPRRLSLAPRPFAVDLAVPPSASPPWCAPTSAPAWHEMFKTNNPRICFLCPLPKTRSIIP